MAQHLKQNMKTITLIALGAAALVSCQQQQQTEEIIVPATIVMPAGK